MVNFHGQQDLSVGEDRWSTSMVSKTLVSERTGGQLTWSARPNYATTMLWPPFPAVIYAEPIPDAQGDCAANLRKWRIASSEKRQYGQSQPQTMTGLD